MLPTLTEQKPEVLPPEATRERPDSQDTAQQQRTEWLRQWRDNQRHFSPYATPPWLPLGQWREDLNYPPANDPSFAPPPPPREWSNRWFFRGF